MKHTVIHKAPQKALIEMFKAFIKTLENVNNFDKKVKAECFDDLSAMVATMQQVIDEIRNARSKKKAEDLINFLKSYEEVLVKLYVSSEDDNIPK